VGLLWSLFLVEHMYLSGISTLIGVYILKHTPIFDWSESKNGHQKDMCYVHIEVICAHNNDTILGSIINTIGRAFVIT
jgi:hypothetical protein